MQEEIGAAHPITLPIVLKSDNVRVVIALWTVAGIVIVVVIVTVGLNGWARRSGYAIPGHSPVRCTDGHLFLTTWVMGASLTKVRLRPPDPVGALPGGSPLDQDAAGEGCRPHRRGAS